MLDRAAWDLRLRILAFWILSCLPDANSGYGTMDFAPFASRSKLNENTISLLEGFVSHRGPPRILSCGFWISKHLAILTCVPLSRAACEYLDYGFWPPLKVKRARKAELGKSCHTKIQDPKSGIHAFELQGEKLRFELERAQSRFSAGKSRIQNHKTSA